MALCAFASLCVLAPRPAAAVSCKTVKKMPAEGAITKVEYLSGRSDLGLEITAGTGKLWVGGISSTGTSSNLRIRGAFEDVTAGDRSKCIAVTNIVFASSRFKPVKGRSYTYNWTGPEDSATVSPGGTRFYIDVNEKKTAISVGAPTIEYSGVSGTFKYTKADKNADGEMEYRMEFSIVFKEVGGSAKTRITGSVEYVDMAPLR